MKKPPQYFEGVLQLRHPTEQILDFVYAQIQKDGRAHIAKEKVLKNGIDLFLSSQHYLQALGKKLKEKFGGVMVVSCRIQTCSHLTSKDLYRVSVLFIPLKVTKGDTVKIHEELWKILIINNQIQLQNVVSGQKRWFKPEYVMDLQKVSV